MNSGRKFDLPSVGGYNADMGQSKEETTKSKKSVTNKKSSSVAGKSTEFTSSTPVAKQEIDSRFSKEALVMARRLNVDRLLFVCNDDSRLEELDVRALKKKIIVASPSDKFAAQAEELGLIHEPIPDYSFDRFEKIKVALAACVSSGKLKDGMSVLCMVGQHNSNETDTCMLTQVGHHSDEQVALSTLLSDTEQSPQVLEAVLTIALSVGFEGIEGDPVGSIFVVGDSTAVMEKSRQLTLNPFQGYSEEERNILDPGIRNAIKNFCLLDGAIIVREDGVLLAAGRYLRAPEDLELDLQMGLGTRNAAAQAISMATQAVSFVISKSSGTVRIYKAGKLAVELKQPQRRT
jgi:DNA integrity scanning protein DisA with diadenylate cyclase activity